MEHPEPRGRRARTGEAARNEPVLHGRVVADALPGGKELDVECLAITGPWRCLVAPQHRVASLTIPVELTVEIDIRGAQAPGAGMDQVVVVVAKRCLHHVDA